MSSVSLFQNFLARVHSSGFQRYLANTSWLMLGRIFQMVITFCVGIFVARYLRPERFGLLNYAMSFVALFTIFATLGLDRIAVRELVEKPSDREIILGSVFWTKLCGALFVFVIVGVLLPFMDIDKLSSLLILIIAAGLIFQPFLVIDIYFQSQVLSKYVVFAQTTQLAISALAKLLLIFLKAPLIWFAIVIMADSILLAIALFCFFRFFRPHAKDAFSIWHFDFRTATGLLKDSWPLILSGFVVTLYMKVDQVMIKEMLDAKSVGLYAVTVRLSESWFFIPGLILQSLFPGIIALKNRNKEIFELRLQQLHDFLSSFAIVIAIATSSFASTIIGYLFGAEYLAASTILSIHIWGGVIVFPGNIRAHMVIIENKQYVALIWRSMGALINVAMNFFLIPVYGPVGAAWATLAAYFFPVVIVAFFDPTVKQSVVMSFKSYLLPFRLLIYGRRLYSINAI